MKIYYDLHIHSVLSSCADVLLTPNNILNICMLKELNLISITDHNSSKQYKAIDLIKDSYDFLVIYGMEVTVKEGFHVLVYFNSYEELSTLDEMIDDYLVKNNLCKNEQIVCDVYDEEDYRIDYNLNQKSIPFQKLITLVRNLNGIIIPSHIERLNTGILDTYSDISQFDIDAVEIYKKENVSKLEEKYPYLVNYKHLFNSDAHDLEYINERDNYIELESLTFESFKKWLKE